MELNEMTLNVTEMDVSAMTNREVRYLIPEAEYDYDHPEVQFWTKHFMSEAEKRHVFVNIRATLDSKRSHAAAETVATAWYDFTRYVPVFLTKAVSQTEDPERQHHLIQIAYDELGGADKTLIHSNLFLKAISTVDLKIKPHASGPSIKEITKVLDNTLVNTKSQFGIIGLLMSFEIIAMENVETLFDGLCYNDECRKKLSDTQFFTIHRMDETEHIRHSVANFLRFCKTDMQRDDFKRSFDDGIDFWHRFWDQAARLINIETKLREKISRNARR